MAKAKKNIKLDLGTSLILIGLVIMMLGIPVEALKPAAIVSINMPGGAGASIEGIQPVSAIMLVVGFITTSTGVLIKYKESKH